MLGKLLGQAIRNEDEIVNLNRELAARYQRYARNPEPKVFPASTGEPLLVRSTRLPYPENQFWRALSRSHPIRNHY